MKRILFLVPRMNIGGAETYVYTAAKELRARGYEVFLASGGGRLADELKTAGIRTFFCPDPAEQVLIRLARFIHREEIPYRHHSCQLGSCGHHRGKSKKEYICPRGIHGTRHFGKHGKRICH